MSTGCFPLNAQDTQAFAAVVNVLVTAALAWITWRYAHSTRVMSDAMARQIVPDIQISAATVELTPETRTADTGFSVNCTFSAWVRNQNSANGSIVEPDVFAIFDDGTELEAISPRDNYLVLSVPGGGIQEVNLKYQFLILHSGPDSIRRTKRLLSSTTRFRIVCKDNLGADRGKGVQVERINGEEDKPS